MTFYNVGIIGLGGMGRVMLADMLQHDQFSVSVIWDPDENACKTAQSQIPELRIAANGNDLIGDKAVNLVYVASPPNSHHEYFLAVVEAGKPILCEKPFGVNVSESAELLDRITDARLPNIINFNHGNALGSTHIEQQFKQGEMGDITGIDIFIHLTQWPREFQKSATWLGLREQGGFTREMISHWLYLSRRLLGDGRITRAHINYPDDGVSAEVDLTADLDFSGIPCFIRVATGGVGPVGTEYTVWGSEQSFRLHSGGNISSSHGEAWTEQFTELEDIGACDRQRTLDGVAGYFNGDAINMADAADGFAVQQLVEALLNNSTD
jgi:1,5-anhydro-D-fructose reductase (1,5-anhydro-D-mannitol-forming)